MPCQEESVNVHHLGPVYVDDCIVEISAGGSWIFCVVEVGR